MEKVKRIALKCVDCDRWYIGFPFVTKCFSCYPCQTCDDNTGWSGQCACADCNDDLFKPKPQPKPSPRRKAEHKEPEAPTFDLDGFCAAIEGKDGAVKWKGEP